MSVEFDFSGSPEDIEKELERIRTDLVENVDQLQSRLTPKEIAADVKLGLRAKAQEAKEFAQETIEKVKDGDRVAKRNVAFAAAGVALVVALMVRRATR